MLPAFSLIFLKGTRKWTLCWQCSHTLISLHQHLNNLPDEYMLITTHSGTHLASSHCVALSKSYPIRSYQTSLFPALYRTESKTFHYHNIIISAMASQFTSDSSDCSTVCSDAEQRNHQSSAPLAFVRGIHRWPVNSAHNEPVTLKLFPFYHGYMSIGPYPFLEPLKACYYSRRMSLITPPRIAACCLRFRIVSLDMQKRKQTHYILTCWIVFDETQNL